MTPDKLDFTNANQKLASTTTSLTPSGALRDRLNHKDAPSILNFPTLPKETILKILTEITQKNFSDYYTLIYTRDHTDCDGVFGQGQIESITLQHKCIYKAPVIDGEIDFLTPANLSWKLALEKNRVLHQLHVYDRYLNPDLVEPMRALWSRHNNPHPDLEAFRCDTGHLLVLTGDIMDDLPFAVDVYGGIDSPNRNAYVKKLHANDNRLECQRRGHIMICSSPWMVKDELPDEMEEHEYLISHFPDRLDANMHVAFHHALFHRRDADRLALLQLDWSLMTGLESLCLDLSGPWTDGPNAELKSFCVKMGSHLKLKTLVVLGLPVRQDYCKLGKDFWIKTLENQEYVPSTVVKSHFEDSDESDESDEGDEGDDDDSDDELVGFPTYIYWLKECLQPGSQVHSVMQYESETEL
ncbi:hypothetical protein Forpi1262_v000834 [Fusarium oxysporum f. sp. raphani]|uniref:Uncharacterized protein n=1 Tax=Fusarium oxysporum f. sp. raphani TaxID=96318 RepID=A0A8J5UQU0_FUSOX|nr:hypothetical protein Forpi1262_v000834 [Fusarium oxysporum f. sp. raphani]